VNVHWAFDTFFVIIPFFVIEMVLVGYIISKAELPIAKQREYAAVVKKYRRKQVKSPSVTFSSQPGAGETVVSANLQPICISCGEKLSSNDAFCPKCNKKIDKSG